MNTESSDVLKINAFIESLKHHNPNVSSAAVKKLVQSVPTTVQPLIDAFYNSTDQSLQAYIVQALAQIANPEAVDLLAEVVGTEVANHCQGNVRRIAARGLGLIGSTSNNPEILQRALEKLTWALTTPQDWGLRYAAAVSLQEIATPAANTALQQALKQESDKVVQARIAAVING
ncbi:PBS lyase HEAT-like repeat protein [Rivularia sp. PCC 7116]|uniref:HEAT repeat domain-containing protein n=1 Tax=Rivularia sp. PCC 7116 TaxID=373994 RepID=UPI00029F26F7|nr:HEAT repeat domain-containing protein [Rivularia sp. PCC 7116]AFY56018.1 PBS lyase HEAT-like repeat protein [Rivularia sp. PCC 7116]